MSGPIRTMAEQTIPKPTEQPSTNEADIKRLYDHYSRLANRVEYLEAANKLRPAMSDGPMVFGPALNTRIEKEWEKAVEAVREWKGEAGEKIPEPTEYGKRYPITQAEEEAEKANSTQQAGGAERCEPCLVCQSKHTGFRKTKRDPFGMFITCLDCGAFKEDDRWWARVDLLHHFGGPPKGNWTEAATINTLRAELQQAVLRNQQLEVDVAHKERLLRRKRTPAPSYCEYCESRSLGAQLAEQ